MRLPPPPLLLLFLILVGVILGVFANLPGLVSWPLNLSGLAPVIGGIFLLKASFELFGRAGTSPDPEGIPKVLIVEGPYRYVRNPIYIGFSLVQLGVALLLGSIVVLAVLPIFLLSVHFGFILREERVLEERFGEAYREYRRTVSRWLPRIGHGRKAENSINPRG